MAKARFNIKNNRGISIIALAITIGVLIILTAVTISSLEGNDGLISSAENVRNTLTEAEKQDNELISGLTNWIDGSVDFNQLPVRGEGEGSGEAGHTHSWSITNRTNATCEELGIEYLECVCGEKMERQISALGHAWNGGETTKAATCVEAGQITYTCSRCGFEKTEEISARSHIFTKQEPTAAYLKAEATCINSAEYYYSCQNCAESSELTVGTYYQYGSALGHSYTSEITTEATCTDEGVKTYSCERCGDSYTEAIIARGHSYTSEITDPTCTEEGIKTYTCENCGDSYTEVIATALGHNFVFDSTTGYEICKFCSLYNFHKLTDLAKVGEYVNYDPTIGGNVAEDGSNITYTSVAGSTEEHGNGSGSQTFSASNYKNAGGKWTILNIEGETITLISDLIYQDSGEAMGTTGLTLENGIGYMWAEEELHRISAIYGHGYGADTNQTVTYYYGGPNDQNGSISEIDDNDDGVADNIAELQQGRKATLSFDTPSGARALTLADVRSSWNPNYFTSSASKNANIAKYYPTLENPADPNTGVSSEQSTFSGSYYCTTLNGVVSNQMFNLEESYWLASRCSYSSGATSSWVGFAVSAVHPNNSIVSDVYYASAGYNNLSGCSAR